MLSRTETNTGKDLVGVHQLTIDLGHCKRLRKSYGTIDCCTKRAEDLDGLYDSIDEAGLHFNMCVFGLLLVA